MLLAVRDRGEWIHAVLCRNVPGGEDAADAIIVGKLLTQAARSDALLFEGWIKLMTDFTVRAVQSYFNCEVDRIETRRRPRPLN
jgi:hypothetical protein